MKSFFLALFTFIFIIGFAQNPSTLPIEERHSTHYGLWILGVILVIAAGVALYMLIKKDPRKDAV